VQDPQQPDSNSEFHLVHFYEPAQFPAESIANFLDQGLSQGEAAVLIASADHTALIEAKMEESGWNCTDLREVGLLEVTDMDEMLREFEAGTSIVAIVEQLIATTIDPAQQKSPSKRIRIYGELEDALLTRLRNAEAALTVERYGNRLASQGTAKIYCGYSTNAFPDASYARPFIKLCQLHDRVHNGLNDRDDWRFQMAEKMSSL
jgi:hypothetical protein